MTPFLPVPDEALEDLRRRLDATRWPDEVGGAGWTRGVPLTYLRELAGHWRDKFDWRAVEQEIHGLDQDVALIDGAEVHYFHVRSPEPDAVPLVLTHGWPGSALEFLDVLGPLADPRSYGVEGVPAFHVVVPSIPGFGFSRTDGTGGWGTARVAMAWAELMRRLGYDRYVAQGGDAGSVISRILARVDPEHVVGVHVNMLMAFPSGADGELDGLEEGDLARLAKLTYFDQHQSAYMKLQATRPQTLAYALTDSPVGQLAWIVERFFEWTDSERFPEDAVDRDRLLAIVTQYWLTATAGSSAQLYFEDAEQLRSPSAMPPSDVPLGVAVFPEDIFVPVRRLAERDHPEIVHWSEFDRGGHFAALEQPTAFVDDVRRFVAALADRT